MTTKQLEERALKLAYAILDIDDELANSDYISRRTIGLTASMVRTAQATVEKLKQAA